MHDLDHPILASAENIDNLHARKGDLQRAFPLDVPMVTSPKLPFVTNGDNLTGIGLTLGETSHFDSLEFTANHLGRLSVSPYEGDSSAIFVGMVHSGSSSLHTILQDFSDEGDTASGAGEALDPPAPEGATW
jgi:hypothetical protein